MDGSASPKRTSYHHGDLKAALVEAGIAMLEEVGPEKLSLRGLAARVGVSHTAPKNHFDGLRGLLTAIAAEGFRRHAAAMTEAMVEGAGPQERLRAAAEGYVDFACANPALFRLMFNPGLPDHADPALQQAGEASYAVLARIAQGLDWQPLDGSPATPRKSELMLWSLVHGYATLEVTGLIGLNADGPPPSVTQVMPWMDYRAD